MIYPKIPRRTLALILFCLLITLGAVGILFLVYFFNESNALVMNSALKPTYGDQQEQYRKNLINNFEQKQPTPTNRCSKDVKESINSVRIGNNRSSMQQTSFSSSDEDMASSLSSSPQSETNSNNGKLTKTINSKAPKDSNTNLDTIYIDDFDRPQTYNSKSKSELNNIDYFDTILVDHNNNNEKTKPVRKLSNLRLEDASTVYQSNSISEATSASLINLNSNSNSNLNDNDRKSRINSKRRESGSNRWHKSKLVKYTKLKPVAIRDDDDAYDLEIDTPGSGSGDFIDDTEINEIFTKQINTKMSRKWNKSVKKNFFKSNRSSRKKHRNYFLNNENEYNSEPFGTTLSSRSFKKISSSSSYPTLSSRSTTEQISTDKNKKWPAPALIFNHQKSILNESEMVSPTPSYNNNVVQSQLELGELGSTVTARVVEGFITNLREIGASENNEAWIETRTRRIMGNVKKSEERSRQLLLCEEAGGGELCRMLFKGHIND